MKKTKKIILVILCMIFATIATRTDTFAITPMYGHRYQNGVSNVIVWLNYGSGVGYWQWFIESAVNNWMYTGWANPIYATFVSSNNGSTMDFHLQNNSFWKKAGILADTRFFSYSQAQVNQWNSDWYYAEININHDEYSQPSFSDDQAIGTTIHEMGHAFGLAHDLGNPYSIMCQTGSGRIVQRVQQVDNDAINILY